MRVLWTISSSMSALFSPLSPILRCVWVFLCTIHAFLVVVSLSLGGASARLRFCCVPFDSTRVTRRKWLIWHKICTLNRNAAEDEGNFEIACRCHPSNCCYIACIKLLKRKARFATCSSASPWSYKKLCINGFKNVFVSSIVPFPRLITWLDRVPEILPIDLSITVASYRKIAHSFMHSTDSFTELTVNASLECARLRFFTRFTELSQDLHWRMNWQPPSTIAFLVLYAVVMLAMASRSQRLGRLVMRNKMRNQNNFKQPPKTMDACWC